MGLTILTNHSYIHPRTVHFRTHETDTPGRSNSHKIEEVDSGRGDTD